MATTTYTIKGMQLNDGATAFDVSALCNPALKKVNLELTGSAEPGAAYNAGNNLIVGTNSTPTSGSYGLKNTDIKGQKSVRLWPGIDGSSSGEIDFMGDGPVAAGVPVADVKQIHLKALISKEIAGTSKNKTIRFKQTCSELELNNKNCTGTNESTAEAGKFDIKVKHDDDFQGCNFKARSIDLRAISEGSAGTGGGIAAQIASCDSDRNENKFKIETSRKKAPSEGLMPSGGTYSEWYDKEGGQGIEIGTINSQFESFGCKEFRRLATTDVFAVTRSAVRGWTDAGGQVEPTDPSAKKWDYITQSDDSKDIKSTSQGALKWVDIINAALYLKAKGMIPSDGTFYGTCALSFSFDGVVTEEKRTLVPNSEQLTIQLTPDSAQSKTQIGTVTVTVGGSEVAGAYDADLKKVTLQPASLTGPVVITANAT